GARARTGRRGPPVRNQRHRPGDLRAGRGGARRGDGARELHPRVEGVRHRSAPRPAERVGRSSRGYCLPASSHRCNLCLLPSDNRAAMDRPASAPPAPPPLSWRVRLLLLVLLPVWLPCLAAVVVYSLAFA